MGSKGLNGYLLMYVIPAYTYDKNNDTSSKEMSRIGIIGRTGH